MKNSGSEHLALGGLQRWLSGSFLDAKICWSNGVVERWSNDKD
jgi:hypothetical protein